MRDEKTPLRGADVREVFEAVLPEDALRQIIAKAKFEERSRKRDAVAFVRAMVIAAATGYGGRQRDVARVYFENGAQRVVRGGFYAWFGKELERATAHLKSVPRALAEGPFARALEVARTAGFTPEEWEAYDRAKIAEQDARGALTLAEKLGRTEGEERGIRQGHAEGLQEGLREGEERGIRQGRAEGRAEGIRQGLTAAVEDLCDLFGIELTAERRREIAGLDATGLGALRDQLKRLRQWPPTQNPTDR